MLEFTPQEANISSELLSQVEKHGGAKLIGENGHKFYLLTEEKYINNDYEVGMEFASIDEFRDYVSNELNMPWPEVIKLAKEAD